MTLVSASGEMSEVEVIAEVGSIEARGLLSGPLQQFCDVGSDPPRLVAAVAGVFPAVGAI